VAPDQRVALPPTLVPALGVLLKVLGMQISERARIALGASVRGRISTLCDRQHDLTGHHARVRERYHPNVAKMEPSRPASPRIDHRPCLFPARADPEGEVRLALVPKKIARRFRRCLLDHHCA
jgi:hypothetical protein